MPGSYKTAYSGYAVEYSPFEDDKLAVSTAQHFGIVGSGRQYILQYNRDSDLDADFTAGSGQAPIRKLQTFDTPDGIYDCCWSEDNENILVGATGDGSVKVWDAGMAMSGDFGGDVDGGAPIRSLEEHTKEVASVDWNLVGKDTFVTGSWDNTIKLWSLTEQDTSLETYDEHRYCVYNTIWSPSSNDLFASASGDYTCKIWDVNDLASVQTLRAHNYEILTVDWNKYDENIVVTGSVDKSIKIWDLRNTEQGEINQLRGHTLGVRRLKCSPHDESIIASCSYDMSLCVWDSMREDALLEKYEHHSEFVVGLDFNLENEDELASCSWDETVFIWNRGEEPIPTHEEDGEIDEDAEGDQHVRQMFAQMGLGAGGGGGGGIGGRAAYQEEEDEYTYDERL